ncbi:FERM central domain protein [Opisthorchis viverrini]|uniref:FERM central domain protein n=1 Tax=Opisthorchis viverrini TaxID=6198 RepID=A0A1S8WRK3_OPIVI|nr:FERM central domain protein [Opisthorchis viverrini]
MVYCLLGAYIIQSEAGDHDPAQHVGIKYIQDHPFAPHVLQTPEMLERMVQLHKLHRGKTPQEADRLFLQNARCLALYGVDLHKVKASGSLSSNLCLLEWRRVEQSLFATGA